MVTLSTIKMTYSEKAIYFLRHVEMMGKKEAGDAPLLSL